MGLYPPIEEQLQERRCMESEQSKHRDRDKSKRKPPDPHRTMYRFYRRETFFCPCCNQDLLWIPNEALADSAVLLHPDLVREFAGVAVPGRLVKSECVLAGRRFYPPQVVELKEYKED